MNFIEVTVIVTFSIGIVWCLMCVIRMMWTFLRRHSQSKSDDDPILRSLFYVMTCGFGYFVLGHKRQKPLKPDYSV